MSWSALGKEHLPPRVCRRSSTVGLGLTLFSTRQPTLLACRERPDRSDHFELEKSYVLVETERQRLATEPVRAKACVTLAREGA